MQYTAATYKELKQYEHHVAAHVQTKQRSLEASAAVALDGRLQSIEEQLSGIQGEALQQRIAAAEWRMGQVHSFLKLAVGMQRASMQLFYQSRGSDKCRISAPMPPLRNPCVSDPLLPC